MQASMVMKIFACTCLLLSVAITGGVFQFSHQPPTELNCNPYDNTSLWRPILVCGGINEGNSYKFQWLHNSTDGNMSVQPSNTILSCDYPTLEINELVNLTGDHWCEVIDLVTNETILQSNILKIYEKEHYNQMMPCHDVPIDNQNIICITMTTTSPSADILAISSPIDDEDITFITATTTSPSIDIIATSSSSVSPLETQSCDNDTTEWRNAFIAVSVFGVITILLLITSTATFLFMWLRVRRKMKISITQKPSTKYVPHKQSIIEIRNPQISIETTDETAPVRITSKGSMHSNEILDILQENKQKKNTKDGADEQEDSEYVEMNSFRESSFSDFKSFDAPTKIVDGNVYAISNDRVLSVYQPIYD